MTDILLIVLQPVVLTNRLLSIVRRKIPPESVASHLLAQCGRMDPRVNKYAHFHDVHHNPIHCLGGEYVSHVDYNPQFAPNGELLTRSPITPGWVLRGVLDSNEVAAAAAGSLSPSEVSRVESAEFGTSSYRGFLSRVETRE